MKFFRWRAALAMPAAALLLFALSCRGKQSGAAQDGSAQQSSAQSANQSAQQSADQASDQPLAVHGLTIVTSTLISSVRGAGFIRGEEEVPVVSKAQGAIVSAPFKAGDKVAAGQVLVSVENSALKSAAEQARASLAAAKTAFDVSKKLLATGAVSRSAMQADRANYYGALAQYNARQQQYQDTIIRAPIAGFVAEKNPAIAAGSVLGAGMVVGRISARGALKVVLPVADSYVSYIAAGDPARVVAPSLGGAQYDAVVEGISSGVDVASGTVEVTLGLVLSAEELTDILKSQFRTGLVVSVEIPVTRGVAYPILPKLVIATENGRSYVYVARLPRNPGDASSAPVRAVKTYITTGADFVGNVEVREGLSVPEDGSLAVVIVSGLSQLSDGKMVTVRVAGTSDAF